MPSKTGFRRRAKVAADALVPATAIVVATGLIFASGLVLATGLPAQSVTRGPYLQSGTHDSVIVKWRTDVATDSRVSYGTSLGQLTSRATESAAVTDHAVTVTALKPDTRYFYAVGSSTQMLAGEEDPSYSFVTAPPPGTSKSTRIWVLGDSGTSGKRARAVRDGYYTFMGNRHTDLWLMLGDNAYNDGTDAEYQKALFEMFPTMLRRSVLWPTLGNHDGHSANSATQTGPYYDIFTLPTRGEAGGVPSGTEAYYSFDYGNIHFVCLESHETDRSTGGAMLRWLEQDLAMNTKEWLIAFWHHPPYSKGSRDSDVEIEQIQMRRNALPILEAGGVDLVLCGHSHSYERSFLLDGHYFPSNTLRNWHKIDGGDGRVDGTGAYRKDRGGRNGCVYIVAGSSGYASTAGNLDHPAMFVAHREIGSVVLDVNGPRMDIKFIDRFGQWQPKDYLTLIKGPTPPEPRFSAEPKHGKVPLRVPFVDHSTAKPHAWLWDFGDGTTSTARNPVHTYLSEGNYSVSLRATNVHGADVLIKKDFITVAPRYSGEGYLLARDAALSASSSLYMKSDTIYVRVWTDRVDFKAIAKSEYVLEDGNGGRVTRVLTNHGDRSYTASIKVADLPSTALTWTFKALLQDTSKVSYEPGTTIRIVPVGDRPPKNTAK